MWMPSGILFSSPSRPTPDLSGEFMSLSRVWLRHKDFANLVKLYTGHTRLVFPMVMHPSPSNFGDYQGILMAGSKGKSAYSNFYSISCSDMSWSFSDPHLLSSCSTDTFIHIWDIR